MRSRTGIFHQTRDAREKRRAGDVLRTLRGCRWRLFGFEMAFRLVLRGLVRFEWFREDRSERIGFGGLDGCDGCDGCVCVSMREGGKKGRKWEVSRWG